jgi:hypothetical protein
MNTEDFIQQYAPDGNLTAQQAAQLLELGGQGDTALAETGGAPDAALDDDQQPVVATGTTNESISDDQLTVDNTVILAKDGKHTIDYQKLLDERAEKKVLKEQVAAFSQEIEQLKAQAQQRADAGIAPTVADQQLAVAEAAIDAGVNPDIFGDFSEGAIASGVKRLVDEQVAKALAPYRQKEEQAKANEAQTVEQAHFGAIYDAHPDLDSILESKELSDWLAAQPAYVRAGFDHLNSKGTAPEVIEFFDSFKEATGLTQQPAPLDARAAAKAAIAKTPTHVPLSLSDIPGGAAVSGGKFEAMDAMNSRELSEAMQKMTPKQREEYASRML